LFTGLPKRGKGKYGLALDQNKQHKDPDGRELCLDERCEPLSKQAIYSERDEEDEETVIDRTPGIMFSIRWQLETNQKEGGKIK